MDKGVWQTTVHRSQRVGHNGRKLARMHTNTEQDEKAKIYETERWTTQVSRCPVCYLENSGEITPERMKRQSQIENNTQLWMWLVMEVKKVPCCEEQYCIGIWNVRFMNQGKLEVAKKKDRKSEHQHFRNQWTKMVMMGEFNSDGHYIYYCGQAFLRSNGVALILNKRVQNTVLGCSLKNDRMISVCFQGKPSISQ